jgi:adenine-specific DNA-methyltransferase
MPSDTEIRASISEALNGLATAPILTASRRVFETLGYKSERRPPLPDSKPTTFLENFDGQRSFNSERGMLGAWKSADFLCQVTDEEIKLARNNQPSLLADGKIEKGNARSFAFLSIGLNEDTYTRTQYSGMTREINRMFNMPAICLFKNNGAVTLSVIDRRQHKKESAKDVLEKVTLVKDIEYRNPHRGHLEILSDLALPNLAEKFPPLENFDHLLRAWRETLDISTLNKRFYRELSNWYFWALPQVRFPADLESNDEKLRATSLIRLLTRLIFCWFLKEKNLIPDKLFRANDLGNILKGFDPESETSSTYYLAILQNLFFATLNQRMGKDSNGNPYRAFAKDEGFQKNRSTYDVNNLYRYESLFKDDPEAALAQFADIPFLNGGLFECLDRTEEGTDKKLYLDGFSRNPKKRPHVPDRLFFDSGEVADLSDVYDDKKRKAERVTGLINILDRYKFTIVENTPIDEEVALDPELLGKVFENLLASYNEETKTTARKQTGSFYTPRPIVDYMVDESLKAHLTKTLTEKAGMKEDKARAGLDLLFTYTEKEHPFSQSEVATLIAAIDALKVLDPACGSGAFPMGVLHKLVYILGKLDPENDRWKQTQLAKLDSAPMREELERTFADNNDDYGRKLYLIENCLYGVDIQPIAIQITKLRFFISLVCDQETNRNKKENHGIRPLPNLETKFVAANSLIGLPISDKDLFIESFIAPIEKEIEDAYHGYFTIQRRDQKLALQKKIKSLRHKLTDTLKGSLGAVNSAKAKHLAEWDPFDPQSNADFFDPHWMFGRSLAYGFDIVIGNPPYGAEILPHNREIIARLYHHQNNPADSYLLFIEKAHQLLKPNGLVSYIVSNTWLPSLTFQKIRRFLTSVFTWRSVLVVRTKVFTAVVDTNVFLFEKAKPATSGTLPVDFYTDDGVRHAHDLPWAEIPKNGDAINVVFDAKAQTLFRKMSGRSWLLKVNTDVYNGVKPFEKGKGTPPQTAETMKDKPFVAEGCSKPAGKYWMPLLRGSLIHRYVTYWNGDSWIQYGPWLAAPRDPFIFEAPSKLFVRQTGDSIIATHGVAGFVARNNLHIIIPKKDTNLLFVLGVLNSRCIGFLYSFINPEEGEALAEVKKNHVEELPIPHAAESQQKPIIELVKMILAAKKTSPDADTSNLEREIDKKVYALYGLAPQEITIVEGMQNNAVSADSFSAMEIQEVQSTKESAEIISYPSNEVSADDQEAEQTAKSKKEPSSQSNNEHSPVRIDETEQNDVLCTIRQMFSEGLELSRELAFKKIAKELGYDRVGSKIEEILDSDIRTAVKRGILENERGTLKILCKTIEGYEREFLKDQFLASIGRPWVEREEAVRAFTRFMGFRRAGEKIQDTVRSLINGLLREDRLESDGQLIRRKS